MDKRVIFAVAGAGKTTYIVDSLSTDKRSLIITYTTSNYNNLSEKISRKFEGKWPGSITLMTYFHFLYHFCYKPFLSDKIHAKGMIFEQNTNRFAKQDKLSYYLTKDRYFYSNRLSFFLEKAKVIVDIKTRIETYFDELIIDEVQDIAGRDFNFLENLMDTNVNMLFVGDFYQHTFDTSRDGNVNQSLFDERKAYEARFTKRGIIPDTTTLVKSWRCGSQICDFVSTNLGISIESHLEQSESAIRFISDQDEIAAVINNPAIVKLHFRESYKYGSGHRNWGDVKGEDCYQDICVMLNKNTAKLYSQGKLQELPPSTRNKLYVAITRAHRDVYLVEE